MEGSDPSTFFTVGKHKGKCFFEVFTNDNDYVTWALKLDRPTGQVAEFVDYINQHSSSKRARSRTPVKDINGRLGNNLSEILGFLKQQKKDINGRCFTVGKHKGKCFHEVLTSDNGYVAWALGLEKPTGQVAEFVDYINRNTSGTYAGSRTQANNGNGNNFDHVEPRVPSLRACAPLQQPQVEYPEYPVGPPPAAEWRRRFYGLMNAREIVTRNRARGLEGKRMYEDVPTEFAAYLRRRICPNVRRRQDRTTQGMHCFCKADCRLALCRHVSEACYLKQLLVFNFGLWRFIGGTVAFSAEVGFVSKWDESTKKELRELVQQAFEQGRVHELFSVAYEGPGKIHKALMTSSRDETALEAVLYNTGPRAVPNREPDITFQTLVGKFRVMDQLWNVSAEVVRAAEQDPITGMTSTKQVADVLANIPYFGNYEKGVRVPTFFTKEVIQDLLDTPVFPGGRARVADLRTYCPAGPGALEGLRLMYGLSHKPSQKQAISMMRAILETAGDLDGWQHGPPDTLELHDIQFMLCELQKFWHDNDNLRDYPGPQPCIALRTDLSFWSARLQEALALGVLQTCRTQVPVLALTLANWLGISIDPLQVRRAWTHNIQNGDRVILHAFANGRYLTLGLGLDDILEPASQLGPTVFRLEREMGAGPVRYGEPFFLRTPKGSHLSPGPPSVPFAAPTDSDRYAETQQLVFTPCSPGDHFGDHVHSGSEVWLQPSTPTLATSKGFATIVEHDPSVLNLADRVIKIVDSVVQTGIRNGTLEISQEQICLSQSEIVRRRLVGVCDSSIGVGAMIT